MSALHPELQGALGQLLQGLSSSDNNLRSQYEESLNNDWQAQKPDALLMGLVEHAHAAQDEKVFQNHTVSISSFPDSVSDAHICRCYLSKNGL